MELMPGLVAIIFLAVTAYWLGIFRGAPFVPTDKITVERLIKAANIKPGEKLADIGSGDGRILIAAARLGALAHGFEINPLLILWSRSKIYNAGFSGQAKVYWKNFWRQDFSGFDVVTIFGITHIMPGLEQKLKKELKSGTRVVCNTFQFPSWPSEKIGNVYVYTKQ